MEKIKGFLFAALAMVMATLSSCNNGSGPGEPERPHYTMFATLLSFGSGACSLEVQEGPDTPRAILTANVTINGTPEAIGKRFLIYFTKDDDQPYVSGPINLLSMVEVINGKASIANMQEITNVTMDMNNMAYMSLTGKWLNLQMIANLASYPRTFGVYVDQSTLDKEYPQVYVGFVSDNNGSSYQYIVYGSFDLSPVLEMPDVCGFDLHYFNNGGKKTQRFEL